MQDKRQYTVLAPAKLNLFLNVKGKLDSGFHEIETVMQTVNLFDELRLRKVPGTGVELIADNKDGLPPPQDNLVFKAAELLKSYTPGVKTGVEITLKKKIPPGAGLGGGSSDAAAALTGLAEFWELGIGKTRLVQIAAELGSDIPFFIHGGTAICRGRGEWVDPIPDSRKDFIFVLALPPIQVSTAEVYSQFDCLTNKSSPVNIAEVMSSLKCGDPKMLGKNLYNSLRESACKVSAELAKAEKTMDKFFSLLNRVATALRAADRHGLGCIQDRNQPLKR